jgi:hypothetical protein
MTKTGSIFSSTMRRQSTMAMIAPGGYLRNAAGLPDMKVVIGTELGQHYGIADLDGEQPTSYRASLGAPLEFIGVPQG